MRAFVFLLYFLGAHAAKYLFRSVKQVTATALSVLGLGGGFMPTAAHAEGSPKFGLFKGRLLPCERKSVCFSTSSVNSVEKYIRPWVFEGDSDAAWAQLKLALQAKETGLVTMKVAEVDDSKHYIHMIGKSTVPPTSVDDVEFLMAYPSDKLVTLRTNTRDPIATPGGVVGDNGNQQSRLNLIRQRLGKGWAEMGITGDEEMAFLQKMAKTDEISRNFGFGRNGASEINFIDNNVPEPEQ